MRKRVVACLSALILTIGCVLVVWYFQIGRNEKLDAEIACVRFVFGTGYMYGYRTIDENRMESIRYFGPWAEEGDASIIPKNRANEGVLGNEELSMYEIMELNHLVRRLQKHRTSFDPIESRLDENVDDGAGIVQVQIGDRVYTSWISNTYQGDRHRAITGIYDICYEVSRRTVGRWTDLEREPTPRVP